MISVVLYGRNDSYGYNLHKRAALSLNCLAHVLSDDDEILFVDYNSPDGFPSFFHAISDTLTRKAKSLSRVIIVPSDFHQKTFGSSTHLMALEPIARNIAIRRSNPKNEWVLSTNTDILLCLEGYENLGDIISSKASEYSFCSTPRFEIPEGVWESFQRNKPQAVLSRLQKASKSLHLEQVVVGDEWNLYDAPGDFQLVRRSTLMELRGFDESMMFGWHCDSNLNKRLSLFKGINHSLYPHVKAYHCDHTRQVTAMHAHNKKQNDPNRYIYSVTNPYANDDDWGARKEIFREFGGHDTRGSNEVKIAGKLLESYEFRPNLSYYRAAYYEKTPFSKPTSLAFLFDAIAMRPKETKFAWMGIKDDLFQVFDRFLSELEFNNLYFVQECADAFNYDIVVVHFGDELHSMVEREGIASRLVEVLDQLAISSYEASTHNAPLFFFLNANHTRFENLIRENFITSTTPFLTKLLSGRPIPEVLEIRRKRKYPSHMYFKLESLTANSLDRLESSFELPSEPWNYGALLKVLGHSDAEQAYDMSKTIDVVITYSSSYEEAFSVFGVDDEFSLVTTEMYPEKGEHKALTISCDNFLGINGFVFRQGKFSQESGSVIIHDVTIVGSIIAREDDADTRVIECEVRDQNNQRTGGELKVPTKSWETAGYIDIGTGLNVIKKDFFNLENTTIYVKLDFSVDGMLSIYPVVRGKNVLSMQTQITGNYSHYVAFKSTDLENLDYFLVRRGEQSGEEFTVRVDQVYLKDNRSSALDSLKNTSSNGLLYPNENHFMLFDGASFFQIIRAAVKARRTKNPIAFKILRWVFMFIASLRKWGR
jgi:hypothetical protein